MKKYIKLMRMPHYIKNLLLFLPIIFNGSLFEFAKTSKLIIGFVAFCLFSSFVYVLNDINDCEKDKMHERKKLRPIASGEISKTSAYIFAALLLIFGAMAAYFACGSDYISIGYLCLYVIINLGYSFGLKNFPILDLALLVSGFLIRVLFGAKLADIEISNWLYLTIISMAFYLSLGKRRNELAKMQENTREVLKYYNNNFLDKNMIVFLGLAIVFYSLWSVDPVTTGRIGNNYLIWTVPIVILIALRYSLNVEKDSEGDPVDTIYKDKVLIFLVLLEAIAAGSIIYFL